MVAMKDLAKETEVFSPTSQRRTVAVDRRSKGGKLWLRATWGKENREQAHGTWLPVEGNEELLTFCEQQQTAIDPLKEQMENLRKQIEQIRLFSRLTIEAATTGSISGHDLDQKLGYGQAKHQLGDGLDAGEWWPRFTATLPNGVGGTITVSGSAGSMALNPPIGA